MGPLILLDIAIPVLLYVVLPVVVLVWLRNWRREERARIAEMQARLERIEGLLGGR